MLQWLCGCIVLSLRKCRCRWSGRFCNCLGCWLDFQIWNHWVKWIHLGFCLSCCHRVHAHAHRHLPRENHGLPSRGLHLTGFCRAAPTCRDSWNCWAVLLADHEAARFVLILRRFTRWELWINLLHSLVWYLFLRRCADFIALAFGETFWLPNWLFSLFWNTKLSLGPPDIEVCLLRKWKGLHYFRWCIDSAGPGRRLSFRRGVVVMGCRCYL